MLPYTANDGLQAIARTHGFPFHPDVRNADASHGSKKPLAASTLRALYDYLTGSAPKYKKPQPVC
jgi:hypothetical protein